MNPHRRQLNVISRFGPLRKLVKRCGCDEYGNRWGVYECLDGYVLGYRSSRSRMIIAFRFGRTIEEAELLASTVGE